jgi:hypothetical protein
LGGANTFAEQLWRGIHTAVNREGCTLVACPRFVCEDCGAVFMLKGGTINLALPHRGSKIKSPRTNGFVERFHPGHRSWP